MGEVRSGVVRGWLEAMGAHGHRALAEASRREARSRGVSLDEGHVPWAFVARLLDDLGRQAGGAERLLREPAADATPYWSELGSIAPAFLDPVELYRFYAEVLGPAAFSSLSFRFERARGEVVIDVEGPPWLRDGTSLFFAHGAVLSGVPVLVGAPRAEVRVMTSRRAARYVVVGVGRPGRASPGVAAPDVLAADLRSAYLEASREACRLEAEQRRLLALERLGRSLLERLELSDLSDAVLALLERDFGFVRCQLWVLPPGSTHAALLGRAGEAPRGGDLERWLEHGGATVGRLVLGRDRSLSPGAASLLERLLPWVAMSLEGAVRLAVLRRSPLSLGPSAAQPPAPAGREEGALAALVAERARRWGLTPRQREVLAGLVRGLSTKQIAAELGCSPNTVEVHVGQVLRKSGAGGRQALLFEVLGPNRRAARTPP